MSRWTPDPTFLEMSPVMTKFPAHDKQAWEQGDISTAALGVFIGKIVSHDLSALAPRLVGFLDNIQIDMDTINAMMLDQKTSGSCVIHKLLSTGGSANTRSMPAKVSCIACTAVSRHDSEGGCQAKNGSL